MVERITCPKKKKTIEKILGFVQSGIISDDDVLDFIKQVSQI